MRLAAKAAGATEREVYLSIADGWRRLAAEADHGERYGLDEQDYQEHSRLKEG